MKQEDISANSAENPYNADQLREIGDRLRGQTRKALNTLDGVQVLESLVQLFEDGKLTSDDLSAMSEIVEARRESSRRAPTDGLQPADTPLSKLSLPSVRLNRFEVWCVEMKELNALAILHEGLLTLSRSFFSYPRVSVQVAPGFDNGPGASKLRLSSVPQMNPLESADPLSTLFERSPLIRETAIPRLDTGAFQAVISVPDYNYQFTADELHRGAVELKNGASAGKVKIPGNHLLLTILRFESDKHQYLLDTGDLRGYWIAGGIPNHRIVNTNSVDWSTFADNLRVGFTQSIAEDEKNIEIAREYPGTRIILRQKSPEAPLPSPYTILARCLDAMAKTHPQKNERVGWLRLPPSEKSRPTDQHIGNVERPEVWEIGASIEQFRSERQLDRLIEALEEAKTGHLLHEHLSLTTSIWLYRTVELLQSRVQNTSKSFFDFEREMQNIDNAYPVSQHQTWGPFREFYDEVARIREAEDYPNKRVRRNHARVVLEKLAAAINDTL